MKEQGFSIPSLNRKYICCHLKCLALLLSCNPRKTTLTQGWKKWAFDQDLDNEVTDYNWKYSISMGSSYCVLCRGDCQEVAVKYHLVSPVCVTPEEFFTCSYREVFWGAVMLLCSSKKMHSWRKEYHYWWSKVLLKFRVFKYLILALCLCKSD